MGFYKTCDGYYRGDKTRDCCVCGGVHTLCARLPVRQAFVFGSMRCGVRLARASSIVSFFLVYFNGAFSFRSLALRRGVAEMATKIDYSAHTSSTSTRPIIFPAKTPLPHIDIDEGITVVSFNVLLPNGNDGWWIYKVRAKGGRQDQHSRDSYLSEKKGVFYASSANVFEFKE